MMPHSAVLDKHQPLTAPLKLSCLLTPFQKHGVIVAYHSCQLVHIPFQLELCRVQPANVSGSLNEGLVQVPEFPCLPL